MWAARRLITCKYSCLTLLKPRFVDPNGFNETINCSEALGPDKMKTLISVNFAFSAIGSVSCVVAILLILLAKVHSSSFVYRLMIYLAFSTLLLEVSIGFQSVPISSVVFGNESGVRMFAGPVSKGWGGFCTGIAYIYQTLWFVQVLTIAWICIYVFVLTVFEIALKELRHHVAGICSILLLPFFISWVPFAYRRYGFSPKSYVCWIIDACTDTEPMTGHLMQLFVSALPAAVILWPSLLRSHHILQESQPALPEAPALVCSLRGPPTANIRHGQLRGHCIGLLFARIHDPGNEP